MTKLSKKSKIKTTHCVFCHYSSSITTHMKEHVKSVHDKITYTYDKKFQIYHKKHSIKSSEERIYDHFCNLCNASFFALKHLNRHKKRSHRVINNEGLMICSKCSFKADHFSEISDHMKLMHSKDPLDLNHKIHWNYACRQCSYVTKKNGLLRKHISMVHFSQKVCELCSYTGENDEQIKRHHMSEHRSHVFSCNFCNYYSTTKYSVQRHIQVKHDMMYNWYCHECNKGFEKKNELSLHLKSKDKKYWVLKCNLCEYRTYQERFLQIHIKRVHDKIKLCKLCSYRTYNHIEMTEHKKSIHKGVNIKKELLRKENSALIPQSVKIEIEEASLQHII